MQVSQTSVTVLEHHVDKESGLHEQYILVEAKHRHHQGSEAMRESPLVDHQHCGHCSVQVAHITEVHETHHLEACIEGQDKTFDLQLPFNVLKV